MGVKWYIFILIIFISVKRFNAQDYLYLKNKNLILIEYKGCDSLLVYYSLFKSSNPKTFTLPISDVVLVRLKNGDIVSLSAPTTQYASLKPTQFPEKVIHQHKNALYFNVFNLTLLQLGFIYERQMCRSPFHVVLTYATSVSPFPPEGLSFNEDNYDISEIKKNYEAGIGMYYHLPIVENTYFYFGPVIRTMEFSSKLSYFFTDNSQTSTPVYVESNGWNQTDLSLTCGYNLCGNRGIDVNFFLSLGKSFRNYYHVPIDPANGEAIQLKEHAVAGWLGFCIGHKF